MHTLEAAGQARSFSRREIVGLVVSLLVPVFLGSLDQTIVATALPTIGRTLGDSLNLSWVVSVYLLTSTAAAPLIGKISDIHGRRVTMLTSQAIFVIGSLGCALSPSIVALIASRAIQGIGAGGLITGATTVLGDIASPKDRVRYYTYFSIVYTASGVAGPALGGFFAENLSWTVIFWMNIPFGVMGLFLTDRYLRILPRRERRHRLDAAGAGLIVAASVVTMFLLDAGGIAFPWASWKSLAIALAALALWAAFVLRLLTALEPLIPLQVLKSKLVRVTTLSNATGWGAMTALNVYLPIYLQSVTGASAVNAGLYLMVAMFAMNISALIGAQITARVRHYKILPMAGLLLAACATLTLAFRARSIDPITFEILIGLIGLGFGPAAPMTSVALQNAVRLRELGTSVAAMSFCRNLASTMLLAAFGAIVYHPLAAGAVGDLAGPAQGAAAAPAFSLVFFLSAVSFFISFFAMIAMEERPLADSIGDRDD